MEKSLDTYNLPRLNNEDIKNLRLFTAAAAKSLQLCPTLCDPIDGSPPRSSVPGILQPRKLEWVAISFSNAWKWKVKVKSLSLARFLETSWTAAYQAPLSVEFSRKEYWRGLPLPSLRLFTSKDIKSVIKNFPTKKAQDQMASLLNSTKN